MEEEKKKRKVRNWVGALFMWGFKLFPIKKNRIYFIARNGAQYACNTRAFFEYLYKNHHDEFEFVWCLNKKNSELPKDVKRVKHMSFKDSYYLHTAKYIINNTRFSMLFSKRKGQVYIMTDHGGPFAYKMVEKDQKLPKIVLWNSKIDSNQMDCLLAGSTQAQEIKEKAFFCEGKTFLTGEPRYDQLINKNEVQIKNTKEKLGLSGNDYIVLYAPTFREKQSFKDLLIDNEILKHAFEKITDKNVKILYRFHPYLLKKGARDMVFENYVLNVTSYPEMQDLILIADILITDFSSCMFDMMVAGKPCVLYTNDADRYLSNERGVYIPLNQLPFPITNNEQELENVIENLDEILKEYRQKVDMFTKQLGGVEDGHSCERVYELMLNLGRKNKTRREK